MKSKLSLNMSLLLKLRHSGYYVDDVSYLKFIYLAAVCLSHKFAVHAP